MGMKKKTIRLVNKLLHDPVKRKLYSDEELLYMEKQVVIMKEQRRARKQQRKQEKGFANESS